LFSQAQFLLQSEVGNQDIAARSSLMTLEAIKKAKDNTSARRYVSHAPVSETAEPFDLGLALIVEAIAARPDRGKSHRS